MSNQVVIMGIWGRAGGNGIPGLISEIRTRLVSRGISPDQVIAMSWNPGNNDSPFEKPDTVRHFETIQSLVSHPTTFVALIGHSYGGWAVCRLSRQLAQPPNFVALIDPVFGPNGDLEQIVRPVGDNIQNWYQRNSVTEPTVFEDCSATVLGCAAGVSCGREIPGVTNHKVKWRMTWEGNRMRRTCPGGRKPRHAFHLNIDSDRFVWRQIIEKIEADLSA